MTGAGPEKSWGDMGLWGRKSYQNVDDYVASVYLPVQLCHFPCFGFGLSKSFLSAQTCCLTCAVDGSGGLVLITCFVCAKDMLSVQGNLQSRRIPQVCLSASHRAARFGGYNLEP